MEPQSVFIPDGPVGIAPAVLAEGVLCPVAHPRGGHSALKPEAPVGLPALAAPVDAASLPFASPSRIGAMELHADLNQRALHDTNALAWMPSPMAGVERRMLDRRGGEVARATSIVRYAPGSRFERHVHGGGEEILVLEGVFSDEQGDYPAGTYLRNPVGSSHAPFSQEGCMILVKLHQMHPADQQRLVIDTLSACWVPGLVSGLSVMSLHAFGSEHVALVRWEPGTVFQPHGHPGGEEILVLDGLFQDEQGSYPAGSWLRNPPGSSHRPWSEAGCTIWVKTGHLPVTCAPSGAAGR